MQLLYDKKSDTYLVSIYGATRPVGKVYTEPISSCGLKYVDYRLEEGIDHFNSKDVYRVVGINNEYVGEWATSLVDIDLGFA